MDRFDDDAADKPTILVSPRALTQAALEFERDAEQAAESKHAMSIERLGWQITAGWWVLSLFAAALAFLASAVLEMKDRLARVETRQEERKDR